MKIIDLEDPLKRVVEVYAMYWINNPSLKMHRQRIHIAGPYEGYDALLAIPEEKVKVVDPHISNFILKKAENGSDILVHWAAEKDDLLDKLLEQDAEAIAELFRRLRQDKPPV